MRNLRERMNRAEKLGEPLPIPDFLKERVRQRATLQQARNLRGAGIDVGSGVVEDVRARVRGARLGTSSSSEEEGFGKGGSGRSRRTPTGFSMPRGDFEVPRTTRGVGVEEKDEPLQRRRIRAPEPEPEPEPERASTPEEDIHRSLTAPGGFSRRAFGSESEEEEDPELAAQLRRQTGGSSGGSSLTPIRGGSGRAGGTQEAGALREALGTVTRSPLTPLERAQEAVDRIHGWTPGGQAVPKGEGVTLQLAPP